MAWNIPLEEFDNRAFRDVFDEIEARRRKALVAMMLLQDSEHKQALEQILTDDLPKLLQVIANL